MPIGIEPSTGMFGNGRKVDVPSIDVDVVSSDQTDQFPSARALLRRQARRDTEMRQPIILGRAQPWRGGHMIPRSLGADFPKHHNLDPELERINNSFVKNIETEMMARVKTLGKGNVHPKVEVDGGCINGVAQGVRDHVYHVDDATTSIKEVFTAGSVTNTFTFFTKRGMQRFLARQEACTTTSDGFIPVD